jgi:hypothetical protein
MFIDKGIIQFIALSLYVVFTGFCFCDGFRMHISRKLIWFFIFLSISIAVFFCKKEYDLALILPMPILTAIFLCIYEKYKQKNK